jgi:hypothetical protein
LANGWDDFYVSLEKNYQDWASDAERLHELAQVLLPQTPKVEVRVSRVLADEAVAAWQREDVPGKASRETEEQKAVRDEAALLALIGQSIEESGIEDGDDVVFKLDVWILGNALESADKAGRLDVLPPQAQ